MTVAVTIREALKPLALRSTLLRRLVRTQRLERGHIDWSRKTSPSNRDGGGRKVLFATSVGAWLPGSRLESTLAAALQCRGAEVHVLLCDADLPACLECTLDRLPNVNEMVEHGPRRQLCPGCFDPAARSFEQLGAQLHRYGDLLTDVDRNDAAAAAREVSADNVADFVVGGVAVGEHALAGALRFFARADLVGEPGADAVLARYIEAAFLAQRSLERLLELERFDVVVAHHGIYVPQGLVGEVSRQAAVRFVSWNPAYRKQSFIFSHGDTYHHTLLDEPVDVWEQMTWNARIEDQLMTYLKSRWSGSEDWIWFHERPVEELDRIASEVGIDFAKPCIGMLTNVMWDAQLHYRANAFDNMLAWCTETVRWFGEHPELQLLIRIHPAEIRGTVPSRQRLAEELGRVFETMPPNVFVIPPESNISTYVAMSQCDTVLIYGTKTGVELTAMGIPVIVAGEAWVRNKGITSDASSPEEYRSLLAMLPIGRRLDEKVVERARRYAYHFFFRRMIPLGFLAPSGDERVFEVAVASVDDLRPGNDLGLDVVCDGILTGSPFVYPSETVASSIFTK